MEEDLLQELKSLKGTKIKVFFKRVGNFITQGRIDKVSKTFIKLKGDDSLFEIIKADEIISISEVSELVAITRN